MLVKNHLCSLMIYNDPMNLMTMTIICAHLITVILTLIYDNDDEWSCSALLAWLFQTIKLNLSDWVWPFEVDSNSPPWGLETLRGSFAAPPPKPPSSFASTSYHRKLSKLMEPTCGWEISTSKQHSAWCSFSGNLKHQLGFQGSTESRTPRVIKVNLLSSNSNRCFF